LKRRIEMERIIEKEMERMEKDYEEWGHQHLGQDHGHDSEPDFRSSPPRAPPQLSQEVIDFNRSLLKPARHTSDGMISITGLQSHRTRD
jgi:hypothetical protein